ncbi:MAG: hypothetical protein QXO32_05870 [Candidatus Bathyarchaeia archaeon]
MLCLNVTVRNLDEDIFRRFKAKAVEKGLKLGEALTQAMEAWVKQSSMRPTGRLSEIKPFNWGEGSEKTSVEVDAILYGKAL